VGTHKRNKKTEIPAAAGIPAPLNPDYRGNFGLELDPPPTNGGAGVAGGSADPTGSGDSGEGDGEQSDGAATVGSLADALEQAIAAARDRRLEQLEEDVDLGQLLNHAAGRGERRGKLARGRGTGLPTGRLPDRGVDRPPVPG
jgi:hypothetical protein